jgi:predicted HTH domain antitoxin
MTEINVFHNRTGRTTERATPPKKRVACCSSLFQTTTMPPIRTAKTQKRIEQEGRIELAIQALRNEKVASLNEAARVFEVPRATLQARFKGRHYRQTLRANCTKLDAIEEDSLENWILDLDARGKAPTFALAGEMANLLLAQRSTTPSLTIGINWVQNFVKRRDKLKTRFSRRYAAQRALCEDPKLIREWFNQYCNTIAQYGILNEDIYNFDETGFAMGITSTSKVITSREWQGKRKLLQPGNREWVTAIECVHLDGVLPPTIIFKAKVLMAAWCSTVPNDWRFEISANGWTTDEIGISWLENSFIPYVKKRQHGAWSALVMDGHGSHVTPQFDTICMKNNIVPICMPSHSSHLLQPLDVGCFSVLKHFYGQAVQDLARVGSTHIDKPDFLSLYPKARAATYKTSIIASSFMAAGIIPYSPETVLSKLDIHPPSPTPPPSHGSDSSREFIPHTPSKAINFQRQASSIKRLLVYRDITPDNDIYRQLEQTTRGAQLLAHEMVMLKTTYERVMAENGRKQRKKALPNRQLPYEGGITAEDLQLRVQIEYEHQLAIPPAPRRATRTTIERPIQRCGNCREPGHKRNRCPVVNNA